MKLIEILRDEDSLFHYTSAETAIKHILFEKQLKLNPLNKMSDPYENKNFDFDFNYSMNPIEVDKKDKQIQIAIKKHCKIVSFCSNEKPLIHHISYTPKPNKTDQRIESQKYKFNVLGSYHSRMWDQYADRHRGVCIVFSKKKLNEAIRQQYSSDQIFKDHVGYALHYLYIQNEMKRDCNKLLEFIHNELIMNFLENKKSILFFTKNIDYINEAEYRFAVYDASDDKSIYIDVSNCIIGVLTGEKCHDSFGSYISDLCNRLGIFCNPIEWKNGKPEVW